VVVVVEILVAEREGGAVCGLWDGGGALFGVVSFFYFHLHPVLSSSCKDFLFNSPATECSRFVFKHNPEMKQSLIHSTRASCLQPFCLFAQKATIPYGMYHTSGHICI
jgi:hypothetical protein